MSPRVPQPDRDRIPDHERDLYDAVAARFARSRVDRPDEVRFEGDAGPYFGALLNSPPFAKAIADLGAVARTRGEHEGGYSHHDREFVDQVLQFDWGWHGVQRTHIPDGLAVGVRPDAIRALRDGRDEDLTDHERELAAYVRQVERGLVTDESFGRLVEKMGFRAAVEYTIFVAFLIMTLRIHQALGTPTMTEEEVIEYMESFERGERDMWDPSSRFG